MRARRGPACPSLADVDPGGLCCFLMVEQEDLGTGEDPMLEVSFSVKPGKLPCQHRRPVFANCTPHKHRRKHCSVLARRKCLRCCKHRKGHRGSDNSAPTGRSVPSPCAFSEGRRQERGGISNKKGGEKKKLFPLPAKNYAAAGPRSVCQMTCLSHS